MKSPTSKEVHNGEIVNISCGFIGASASSIVPDWSIAQKNMLTAPKIFSSSEIVNHHIRGLKWIPDYTSGVNNSTSSKLLVGPVDETYNGSTYQCLIPLPNRTINSTKAVLTVIGNGM